MNSRLHAAAAVIALLCVLSFMAATVVAEIAFRAEDIAFVKRYIVYALFILIPALATTGATGFVLSRKRRGRLIEEKMRRMKVIAFNGLLVLVPSAFYLCSKAERAEFDAAFIGVQALELLAGAINVALMSLNVRDGLRMARARTRLTADSPARTASANAPSAGELIARHAGQDS